ncbi:MAG: CotH kinase family protein, partial [Verrucomicrobiales bacterium]
PSDWIEIYNGQAAAVNLTSWTLTDLATNRTLWTFPSLNLPGYGYLVVFASGKNRTNPAAPLHTNFSLTKESGYLALVRPGGTVLASEFNYGPQAEDVSYGLLPTGTSFAYGYLETPTPGARNTGLQEAGPPAEEVVFLKDGQPVSGGLFAANFSLSLMPPVAPGSVIRYTLNNTIPSTASPAYTNPLTITSTTTIRARVYSPNQLPGPVTSRTFIRLDASLTNYNGSGLPFSSNLPIVVLDSFGVPVDAYSDSGQQRPYRLTYAVTVDKDPLAPSPNTGRAVITGPADFQGRSGTHVRGESSSGFPQKSYSWELWNNEDEDKEGSLLGFPAESDWVLHAPYTDKTLMRNHLVYDQMRALSGKASAMGVKFVEVFFNQDGGSVTASDYRGVYVLIEKIKRDSERVAIEKLNPLMTDPALISGGYIFKKDKAGIGNTSFSTSTYGQTFQFVEPETPNAAQLGWLNSNVNAFEAALAGANFAHPTTGYAAYMDPLSFINNQWFVEITKQIDGYRLSTYFHKDRNGKIFCAPIWDYNLSLYNADYLAGDNHAGWYYNSLGGGDYYYWPRLHLDPNYKILHWDRYWELRRGRFASDTILGTIDTLASQLVNSSTTPVTNSMPSQAPLAENPAMRHYRKWPILGTYVWPNAGNVGARTKFWNGPNLNPTTYTSADAEVDAMKSFLKQRLAWIDDQNYVGSAIYRPPSFSHPGGSVPTGTTLTITRYTGTPPGGYSYASGGTLYYTLDGTDPRPSSGGAGDVVLISGSGNACQWLVPSAANGGLTLTAAAGAQQWTNYTAPPNNAQWNTATTGVGYERNPGDPINYLTHFGTNANTEAAMYSINPTCYLRVAFNIPNQAALDAVGTLTLGMKYDDGFRTYLNGVAIAGRNDTDPSLTSNPPTAQANQTNDDSQAINFESIDVTTLGRPALRVGTNVLAVHALNSPATSSDFLIAPRLTYQPVSNSGSAQTYTGPITLNTSAQVRARLFANGNWSPLTSANFIVGAVPASAANLVISELCYKPLAPAPGSPEYDAGFTAGNNFEYLELLNVSASPVDLTNCQFTTGITFHFSAVSPEKLLLMPGARALVVENEAAFLLRYGSTLSSRVLGSYSGNLSNSGETVTLLAANSSVIASLAYGIAEPWPVAASDAGYSLVMNSPAANPTYQPLTFRAGAQPGGTPGAGSGPAFSGTPTADTDSDGASDLLEYTSGTSPTNPASVAAPVGTWQELTINGVPGTFLTFSYRRAGAADGITCVVERSTALGTWSSDPSVLTYHSTVNHGDGTSTVTWRSTQPITATAREFVRLRVTQP